MTANRTVGHRVIAIADRDRCVVTAAHADDVVSITDIYPEGAIQL